MVASVGIEVVLWLFVFVVVSIFPSGLEKLLAIIGTDQLFTLLLRDALALLLKIITTPIMLIGETLLYFDLRIRKEAFDLEMMARNIHGTI
jgi:hypothetical protein